MKVERILVISLRFLGDALLTTPLIRVLKQRFPEARIDVLSFRGVEAMLEGNPDISQVMTISERPGRSEQWALIKKIYKQYDLALIPQVGDKPHLYGLLAASYRVGLIPQALSKRWWKQLTLQQSLVEDPTLHRTLEYHRLAIPLGCSSEVLVQAPKMTEADPLPCLAQIPCLKSLKINEPFIVLHPSPRWRYKQWTLSGWQSLISKLLKEKIQVVLSGGPGEKEGLYIQQIIETLSDSQQNSLIITQGELSFAQLTELLKKAKLYIGPDTGTTHLAAASGTPTIALFGPTDPRLWGPTPDQGLNRMWEAQASKQQRGNVLMMQGITSQTQTCLPCQAEGCDKHRESRSACMDALSPETVWVEAQRMLAPNLSLDF